MSTTIAKELKEATQEEALAILRQWGAARLEAEVDRWLRSANDGRLAREEGDQAVTQAEYDRWETAGGRHANAALRARMLTACRPLAVQVGIAGVGSQINRMKKLQLVEKARVAEGVTELVEEAARNCLRSSAGAP